MFAYTPVNGAESLELAADGHVRHQVHVVHEADAVLVEQRKLARRRGVVDRAVGVVDRLRRQPPLHARLELVVPPERRLREAHAVERLRRAAAAAEGEEGG